MRRTPVVRGVRLAGWLGLGLGLVLGAGGARGDVWEPYRTQGTIHIITADEDGALRKTPVWVVVVGDHAYVRTNDSRWLANIRRGSKVTLRSDAGPLAVRAEETAEPGECARVEEAYKQKYGLLQRLMSWLRLREPTVLRLSPAAEP